MAKPLYNPITKTPTTTLPIHPLFHPSHLALSIAAPPVNKGSPELVGVGDSCCCVVVAGVSIDTASVELAITPKLCVPNVGASDDIKTTVVGEGKLYKLVLLVNSGIEKADDADGDGIVTVTVVVPHVQVDSDDARNIDVVLYSGSG
jgi:hypothetical protein